MKFATSAVLVYLALLLAGLAGWVMNLISLIHLFTSHAAFDVMFLGRLIGVPVPIIGAILGWF